MDSNPASQAELKPDPERRGLLQSHLAFPVVGIGASAGGMRAVTTLLEHCPANTGMAFVVILHLSPKHVSQAESMLQRATRMKVKQVTQPTPLQADHVYVIPPNKALSMNDGYLRVSSLKREPGTQHASVDLFFRTLAQVHRERAVAAVLSGMGSDGAVGIARVKELGGLTLAQAPDDAEYPSMPESAIATGLVDMVLPASDMAGQLLEVWRNVRSMRLPRIDDGAADHTAVPHGDAALAAEQALGDILGILHRETRNDFRHYKRATILRRIERRMQVSRTPDLPAYRDYLAQSPAEATALLADMLISVTNFFRDREAFEALERDVVIPLFRGRGDADSIRVWVPGCATGEEAYSITMLLCEQAEQMAQPPAIQVFATDIDEHAIDVARTGCYPESIVTDLPPGRLNRYFVHAQGEYKIRKGIREKILFATHNIMRDPPFSRLDLVSCRNLLIYLERDAQKDTLDMLHFALRPGGYLFLGASESADAAGGRYSLVDRKNRIYRANKADAHLYVPALPVGAGNGHGVPAKRDDSVRAKPSYADIHERATRQSAPPSVLVDAANQLVHMSQRVGRFLRFADGEPSHDVVKLVLEELRPGIRTALFQARQSDRRVESEPVALILDGVARRVAVTAQRYREEHESIDFVLLTFEEHDAVSATEAGQAADGRDIAYAQLEEELQRTRLHLRETVERSETFNEEMKASNEELQSINEELRSASEELETNKEELQSVNEELITVNHEMKTKVEEISKINDDLQNLISSTEIPTIFVDQNLCIKRFTPRATTLFNIIPVDVGRSLLDITHHLNYDTLHEDVISAFSAVRVIEREVTSNRGQYLLARILPYRTTEDRIEGAVMTFIDITRRREAEASVVRNERLLRAIIESATDYAILTLDEEGLITSWNKGAVNVFGYEESEVLGQSHSLLFGPRERAEQVPARELNRARESGRHEHEYSCQRKNGDVFWCAMTTMRVETDEAVGYARICRDVTKVKHAEAVNEAMLRHEQSARQAAETARDLKDEFLAVMSHELKHPLNLIHVNAELLRRMPEARTLPAVLRAADTICETVAGQAKIIDDLLDLSRMQTGKLSLHPRPVTMAPLLRRIAEVARTEARAKGLELRERFEDGDIEMYCDPVRIEQVVWNLLSNAIKFTPSGWIEIAFERVADECVLVVRDSGQGIAAEFLPNIFDMFSQADARTTRQAGGLGIGLALVRQVARAHGGDAVAASDGVGRGAAFTVRLPLGGRAATAAPKAGENTDSLAGYRILLVEDTPDTRAAFVALLSADGADVCDAASGEEALGLARNHPFDLILSDIGMPGMDGLELMRRLRELEQTRCTPAVAITGYGRASDMERTLDAGFDAHVGKPVALETLREAVAAARRKASLRCAEPPGQAQT